MKNNIVAYLSSKSDINLLKQSGALYDYVYSEKETDIELGIEKSIILEDISDLNSLDNCLILIVTQDIGEIERISEILLKNDLEFTHLSFMNNRINTDFLYAMGKSSYTDNKDNKIVLREGYQYTGSKLTVAFLYNGAKSTVSLGRMKIDKRFGIYLDGDECYVSIGDGTTVLEANMSCGHMGKIIIGQDCMLSHFIEISSDDGHHIFNLNNGARINYTKDIIVGNHVWIGRHVMLLGGAHIGNGCVLGASCVTSGTFPENVIVAGNPGKIIRKDVLWTRNTTRKKSFDFYDDCECTITDIIKEKKTDNNVKVSVIIPIYNVESYIEECLQSALHQTLTDIEIICVNDGTPDNSMEVVNRYIEDKRIKIVNKENGGLSSARNAGLQVATGEYVYFLDSDDYIKENTLETLYSKAKENNLDNIFFGAESFFESEEVEKQHENYKTYYNRKGEYKDVMSGVQLMEEMTNNSDYRPSACLQMPRRSFLVDNDIRFYEGILHEDNLFTFQNMLAARRVQFVDIPFYCRRVRENSIITEKVTVRNVYGLYTCFRETMNYYVKKKRQATIPDGVINAIKEILSYFVRDYNKLEPREREEFFRMLDVQEELRLRIELQREFDVAVMLDGIHNAQKEQELEEVKNSITFKVGKAVMFVPHKLKKILKR